MNPVRNDTPKKSFARARTGAISNGVNVKKKFPIFRTHRRLVYLDSAATSQKPDAVIAATDAFYRTSNGPVHRGIYGLAEGATERYEAVRDHVRTFINARHPEEVIFTSGTTTSINAVVGGLAESMKKGDRVLLTDMEHHAMIVPWQAAALRRGFLIDFVPLTPEGRIDMRAFNTLLKRKPKFVGLTHVSNVLGTVNPIKEMVATAHRVGAVVLVDAAQSAPHMPLDVQKLDCDLLVFSGHKLYGPNGVGVLYGKKTMLERLPPFLYGGHMIESVTRAGTSYAGLPAKFEAGTPPVAEVIGLGAALAFIEKTGWSAIRTHERLLTAYALKTLRSVRGLTLLGPATVKDRIGIFSFSLGGAHPHDVAALLDREGVAVRAGHHCTQILHERFSLAGSVRVSLGVYNTKQDIDRLVAALERVNKKLHG